MRQLGERRIVGTAKQTQADGGGSRSKTGAAGRAFDYSYRGGVSAASAKVALETMWDKGGEAAEVIRRGGLEQISDSAALETIVAEIVAAHPAEVAQYAAGKEKLLGFFVGQAMKATRGRGDPAQINQILRKHLPAPTTK